MTVISIDKTSHDGWVCVSFKETAMQVEINCSFSVFCTIWDEKGFVYSLERSTGVTYINWFH